MTTYSPGRDLRWLLLRPWVLVGRLVEATGAAVVMAYAERLPCGRGYSLHLSTPDESLTGPPADSARALNRAIETLVRQCPGQYLWSYNRYKVPAGAENPKDEGGRRKDE